MSLILEALRKSEQQRRLGEPPTLASESAWAARRWHGGPARTARWPWIAGALALLLVGGGAAWWLRPAADAGAPASVATAVDPSAAANPGAPSPTTAPSPVAAPAAAVPPAMAAPSSVPPTPAPVAAADSPPAEPVVAAGPVDPAIAARLDAPTPAPEGEYPEVPAPADAAAMPQAAMAVPPPMPAPAEAAPMAAAPDATAPAAVTSPAPPAVAADARAAAPAPAPAEASIVPPPATPPAGDVPLVYALPLATRQALPPLKLSMHVWNADPARRFVILGDTRAAEGESAGNELTVVEIRRDGLVLDFRGTRFLLPRGGY